MEQTLNIFLIDKAIYYHKKALSYELVQENKADIALIHHQIGILYHNKGEFSIAIKYCVEAAKIYRIRSGNMR